MNRQEDVQPLEAIAVIGMAGRFPGAKNVDELWHNLCNGVEAISQFSDGELLAAGIDPALLVHARYVRSRAVLEDIELFDAAFFGFTPRDAELTDPQQRLFLECAWEALEHAGYNPGMYRGRIGVYAGAGLNTYLLANLYADQELIASTGLFKLAIGNDKDSLTTRTSYKLNLQGPSVSVNTMCSTSLVAIHLACQSLLNGECEMALAGGVRIKVPPKEGYLYQEGGIHSPDGHCRAFDASAQGTVGGDGVGIVVLKRLEDAFTDGDTIYAIVRGSAINNDGAQKVGYTAPSVDGQVQVIAEAQAVAGVEAETITYIEAHGTATALGDPIEIAALTQAFHQSTRKKNFCAIGSVKTNVGHLDTAAGVTGFIKAVLALKHEMIPPSLHFRQPNAQIDFANSPFYVNDKLSTWKTDSTPRRAGVSSFGIGGTNAHAVLEEAPLFESGSSVRPYQLVMLSARSDTALSTMKAQLAKHLGQYPTLQLADVAYTLQVGRKVLSHRMAFICQSLAEAVSALETQESQNSVIPQRDARKPAIVYMFPGQGAQHSNMAGELYQLEPTFRKNVDRCAELLEPHLGLDIRRVLYPQAEQTVAAQQQLKQTAITQPLLFTLEFALAKLWMKWGVRPWAMIGHSIGEYVAACLAGVFSLEDGLALVAARGRMMQALPAGAMLAISLPPHKVNEFLKKPLALAAVNGSSHCVVSGPEDVTIALAQQLEQNGTISHRLETSHAFHSAMMDPIVEEFIEKVKTIKLAPPTIPYVSNLTGTWITPAEATDPDYWGQHLRHTVRFADGVQTLLQQPECILLEVGPGQTLRSLVKTHPARSTKHIALSSLHHPSAADSDIHVLLNTLGQLWLENVELDWPAFYAHEQRLRIPLPTYPFERKRYWIDLPQTRHRETMKPTASRWEIPPSEKESTMSQMRQTTLSSTPAVPVQRQDKIASMLRTIMSSLLGITAAEIDQQATFLELGAESLLLLQASSAIQDSLGIQVPFHLLLDQYPTITALAKYIGQQLSPENLLVMSHLAETERTIVEQKKLLSQAVSVPPYEQPTDTMRSSATPMTSEAPVTDFHNSSQMNLEQIIALQLQVMSQQLAMLGQDVPTKGMPLSAADKPPLQAAQPGTEKPTIRAQMEQNIPLPMNQAAPLSQQADRLRANGHPAAFVEKGSDAQSFYRADRLRPIKGLNEQQEQHIEALITRFNQRTQGSKSYAQTYRQFLADSKTSALFNRTLKEAVYPIVVQKGIGSKICDVDQNEYIDVTLGSGSLLFGHSPSFLVDVLEEQVRLGMRIGAQSDLVGPVAKLLCEITGKERAFFCNSGTEAVMTALRLARTVTGRNKIAMFVHSYHGTFDGVLANLQETGTGAIGTIPLAPGVSPHMVEDVIVLRFGQPESLQTLKAHAHALAAVLVEPVQSRRPDLQPVEYLHALRQITEESGAALIFDEVVTGFRSHLGGVQALFGLEADLTIYGKALGSGMPVAAIAGKATYMDAIDGGMWNYGDASYPPAMQTFVAGTYFKHPFVMGVVWAVLNHIRESGPELQQRLNQYTAQLAETLNTYFLREQVPIRIAHFSSLFRFVFLSEALPVEANIFFCHLLEKGIYVGETRNCFLSTAHTTEDIATIINIVKESVVAMKTGGFFISHIRERTQGSSYL